MKQNKDSLIELIHLETGKSKKDASGEVDASISQGIFFASEGSRFYGKTLTSSVDGKNSFTMRMPLGIVGLIVPANTPLANICWKLFPALICGNTVVLKASEDAPMLANFFVEMIYKSSLPKGVVNLL
jgi:aldehyde dehydrogenase (NAD+)